MKIRHWTRNNAMLESILLKEKVQTHNFGPQVALIAILHQLFSVRLTPSSAVEWTAATADIYYTAWRSCSVCWTLLSDHCRHAEYPSPLCFEGCTGFPFTIESPAKMQTLVYTCLHRMARPYFTKDAVCPHLLFLIGLHLVRERYTKPRWRVKEYSVQNIRCLKVWNAFHGELRVPEQTVEVSCGN